MARGESSPAGGQPAESPASADLRGMVASQAAAAPGKLAIDAPDGVLTYADIDARAEEFASRLMTDGAGTGSLVATIFPRSAALVVAQWAVMKAGAAYVSIDPEWPEQRIAEVLEHSGADHVMTVEGVSRRQGRGPVREMAGLAYVMYTSGSSGAPRGVMVETAGLANLACWHRDAFSLTSNDRSSLLSSPGFDASAWEIWSTLAAGASLHVPPAELRTAPADLRDWLIATQISVAFVPTVLAEALMRLDWPRDTGLRYLLTGGDRLLHRPPSDLPFTLVNNYGLTEASVVSTSGHVRPAVDTEPPSIGRPIDNVRCRVVDGSFSPVPQGEFGELLLAGVSLARGYLDLPGPTSARFLTDPHPELPGRWYRTGDRVRVRPDGELDYEGRLDEQINVLGQRVEPAEVETALLRHPDVIRVAALGVGEPGACQLVACVVARSDDARPTTAELSAWLRRYLPDYMVPVDYVWLETMPLTTGGKVDRRKLLATTPAPMSSPPGPGDDLSEADEQAAAIIGEMVKELLELSVVGPDDNFFVLGGHSLFGAQLITRIEKRFGVELARREVFENPTVRSLTAVVNRVVTERVMQLTEAEAARLLAQTS